MSAPSIKTPLTYGDALELATEAVIETVKGCSHGHPRAPERAAQVLMAVDQASRAQAIEDRNLGPLRSEIHEFLDAAIAYFADRADCDQEVPGPRIANDEMKLLLQAEPLHALLQAEPIQSVAREQEALDLFRQIAEGQGPYSRDQLTHAANTIDAMKALAQRGIALYENPSPGQLTGAESGGGSGQVQNAMDQAGPVKAGSGVTAGETAPPPIDLMEGRAVSVLTADNIDVPCDGQHQPPACSDTCWVNDPAEEGIAEPEPGMQDCPACNGLGGTATILDPVPVRCEACRGTGQAPR